MIEDIRNGLALGAIVAMVIYAAQKGYEYGYKKGAGK